MGKTLFEGVHGKGLAEDAWMMLQDLSGFTKLLSLDLDLNLRFLY